MKGLFEEEMKSKKGNGLVDRRLLRCSMPVRIDTGEFIHLFSVKNLFKVLNGEEWREEKAETVTGERYLPQLAIISAMTG